MASTTLIFDILAKDRASGTFRAFGREIDNLDKKARGLSHLGSIGGKVALGAAGGIAAIVGVTANFEKAMSSVKAATGEGADGMDALRDAAIQAGAETAFSASEAAAGIENLAKAGVSTQDILGGGLTGALDLAAAGQIDVALAAESAASAMTQFGLAGADVPHIADLLAAAAGKAQGEVTDMAAALNQSGLVADQVGLSIEETTGALGAFASAGLLGSDAGTSFKTMLGALTPNSAKAKTAMEDLGISAYDAQGNFIGLSEFAGKLQAGLSTLTDEQRQATLETIFGSDAVRAAAILYEQGADGVQTWIDKVNDSGFAAEQAETKLDNLAGDFEALKGSLETALIGAGEGSQGPLRKLVQGTTDAVNAFNKLPAPAQGATTALLGVTAILGGGLWAAGKVVQGIADTRQALSDLGVQAGTTKNALRGLGAAGVALAVAIPIIRQFNDALLDDKIKIGTGNIQRELESIGKGVPTKALDDLVSHLGMVSGGLSDWDEKQHELNTGFGLFGDTVRDKATKNIQELDESLASLVEGGQADQAAAAFAQIQQEAAAAGLTISSSGKYFEEYGTALRNAGLAADPFSAGVFSMRGALGRLARGLASTDDAAGEAAEGIDGAGDAASTATRRFEPMSKALKAARTSARGTAQEFFNLGDSLDDNKTSLAQWIKDMRESANALRNFRKNAETAAEKGLDQGLIQSLNEAGPAGALRMRQLANATDAEIKKANRAWRLGQSEVNKYTDAIGGVPKKVKTDVELDLSQVYRGRDTLLQILNDIPDERVNIYLDRKPGGGGPTGGGADLGLGNSPRLGAGTSGRFATNFPTSMRSASAGSGSVYAASPRRMVVEVRVVGELDTSKAKAQLEGIATEVFAHEFQEERRFERTQR